MWDGVARASACPRVACVSFVRVRADAARRVLCSHERVVRIQRVSAMCVRTTAMREGLSSITSLRPPPDPRRHDGHAERGYTALHFACSRGDVAAARALVVYAGADVSAARTDGATLVVDALPPPPLNEWSAPPTSPLPPPFLHALAAAGTRPSSARARVRSRRDAAAGARGHERLRAARRPARARGRAARRGEHALRRPKHRAPLRRDQGARRVARSRAAWRE